MQWSEVQITTTPEAEEAVVNLFYEAGAEGVAIESIENLVVLEDDPTVNYIDESLLEMDPGETIIRGYFSEDTCDECIHKLLTGIKKLPEYGINPGESELSITEVDDEDWANSWKQYYKPTKIGKDIVIKPTWEEYEAEANEIIINMDPGMAFGTGIHETTKLCVSKLEEYVHQGDVVFDIGCGTGILSIVAVELGAQNAIAVDLDSVAVRVANENVERNGEKDRIEVRQGNLMETIGDGETADIVVANILAEAIIEMAESVPKTLNHKGVFIASGIISERLEAVVEVLQTNFTILDIEQMGEWRCITAQLR